MKLKIKPAKINRFPLGGFLIKNASVKEWFLELQCLSFSLNEIVIYPIPDTKANSIWGCLIISSKKLTSQNVGKNELCQQVFPNFFIPEKSNISPAISIGDREKLFSDKLHLYHPEFGMVELARDFNIKDILTPPKENFRYIFPPSDTVFMPKRVKSFFIVPVSKEETIKNMEENIFPKSKVEKEKSLSIGEKIKLSLLKSLFSKSKKRGGIAENVTNKNTGESGGGLSAIGSLLSGFGKSFSSKGGWLDRAKQRMENLEERNKKELDKLMEMFKNNPEEALKYAIPLDEKGTTRGTNSGAFNMFNRWGNFSLSSLFSRSNYTQSGGGGIDMGNHFEMLDQQYRKTALELIEKKNFEKAAFIYMKLLNDNHLAADALEKGKFYQEAAIIYLKHCNDKLKAAVCYEKGNMTKEAIELYIELKDYLKVGDLYMKLNKRKKAYSFYEKKIEEQKAAKNYYAVADIYRDKMNDLQKEQDVLMMGWDEDKEATRCLKRYFHSFSDLKEKGEEIQKCYLKKVHTNNSENFITVILKEFKKNNVLHNQIKELGYEIIAEHATKNNTLLEKLNDFNPKDNKIKTDVFRFKQKQSNNWLGKR